MHSAPIVRSFSGMHSVPRFASPGLTNGHVTTQHLATQHLTTTHVNTVQGAITHTNLVSHPVQGAGHVSALRNNTFASLHNGTNRALANATFHGRFARQNWHNFNGGWYWHNHFPVFIVIGWWGPVFWPWAWWDFIDFAFWPYAYDVFWPYAYDDIYWGLYGPYAYPDPAYVTAPSGGRYATRAPRTARAAATGGEVCTDRVPTLTDWPIEQITKTVEPNGDQQTLLGDLKDATAKALDALQAACPNDLPSTPTGRLAVMRTRVEAMLQAVGIVHPALDHLYNSLSDEQKARFNALTPEAQPGCAHGADGRPRARHHAGVQQSGGQTYRSADAAHRAGAKSDRRAAQRPRRTRRCHDPGGRPPQDELPCRREPHAVWPRYGDGAAPEHYAASHQDRAAGAR